MKRRVAVIGGGASGMMAAIFSAKNGDSVTVFEKNPKIGRKLYITGKGRCNLTNNCNIQTVIANTPTNGRFLYSALNRFSPSDTMRFFEDNGLPLKTERGNRVFPVSDKASDVVDTLFKAAKKHHCEIINRTVTELIAKEGHITGLSAGNKIYEFDKIIVACGGKSYPLTGSTGDGYAFAASMGHTITPLYPSLVPLETVEKIDPLADKLLLKNISVSVYDTIKGNKRIFNDFGELQLMRYGVTGAVILSASSHMREMVEGRYKLELDLKPALTEEKLDARLIRQIEADKGKSYEYMLRSLMPSGLINMFIEMTDISSNRNCSEITRAERKKIILYLKHFILTVKGYRPVSEAIITSGGVDVREIDPKTMESKLIKGLYFAGEVIDVDAYTGGFNLQAAFSTGVLAGEG